MRSQRIISGTKLSERGVVSIETALTFPVIVMFIFCSIDFGILMESYFRASRVAYEIARHAAAVPGLEREKITTNCTQSSTPAGYRYSCSAGASPNHTVVHNRAATLLNENGFGRALGITISTELVAPTGVPGDQYATNTNYVKVDATIELPILVAIPPLPSSLPIAVTATTPYLYR